MLALAMPALGAKFYKWVDEDGVTHYDTKPPAGQPASEEVRTYHSASSDQDEAVKRLEERRAAEAQAEEAARQRREEQRRIEENPGEVSEERCAKHRENLRILENKPIVRVENPETGEMEVIDQARRERMLEKARAAVEFCEK
ncbi:hypothetical protein Y5W_00863 [Alcanivorax sp. 521-1]|uniref:DUF4124 domain-containing protein n=1 Tax=Alloalcanivorax profundimaris TaxID=2735259 RepID=A0ABS0ANP9_9GAMM|nr:hypothetical protein [Alloalcanivorax profundimaris]